MTNDTIWSEADLADLRREFVDVYGGRTVLVTGADGFMGSHLTDALVALGANRMTPPTHRMASRPHPARTFGYWPGTDGPPCSVGDAPGRHPCPESII